MTPRGRIDRATWRDTYTASRKAVRDGFWHVERWTRWPVERTMLLTSDPMQDAADEAKGDVPVKMPADTTRRAIARATASHVAQVAEGATTVGYWSIEFSIRHRVDVVAPGIRQPVLDELIDEFG